MKSNLLFPRIFRTIGIVLLPIPLYIFFSDITFPFLNIDKDGKNDSSFTFTDYNLTNELAIGSALVFCCFIAFSRLKHEDEYVRHIRLTSLQISVYLNYLFALIFILTVNGLEFLLLTGINIFTIVTVFILVFNFKLYILPRMSKTQAA